MSELVQELAAEKTVLKVGVGVVGAAGRCRAACSQLPSGVSTHLSECAVGM